VRRIRRRTSGRRRSGGDSAARFTNISTVDTPGGEPADRGVTLLPARARRAGRWTGGGKFPPDPGGGRPPEIDRWGAQRAAKTARDRSTVDYPGSESTLPLPQLSAGSRGRERSDQHTAIPSNRSGRVLRGRFRQFRRVDRTVLYRRSECLRREYPEGLFRTRSDRTVLNIQKLS